MPKRPREHELETLSRRAFERVLPSKWVCRSKELDYGIDVEVEIFESDGSTTGLVFLGQLKGTDEKDENKARAVKLELDTLRYFDSLSLPVLIVRYVEPTGTLYVRWNHELARAQPRGKKTFTFRMEDSEGFPNNVTPASLANNVRLFRRVHEGRLQLPIAFRVTRKGVAVAGNDKEAFRRAFAPYSSVLRLATSASQDTNCAVDIADTEASISINGIIGASVHYERRDQLSPELLAAKLAFGFGLVTSGVAHLHVGAPLLAATPATVMADATPEDAMSAVKYLLRNRDTKGALELVRRADEAKNDLAVMMMTAVLFHPLAVALPGHDELVVEFNRDRLRRLKGTASEAIAWYNLGNGLRRVSAREALTCYRRARKLDRAYATRGYWWREVAGVLHTLHRYRVSAICYARAIELGDDDPNCTVLFADSLMFAGEYAGARTAFECAAANGPLAAEWVLKNWFLDLLLRRGIARQSRNYRAGMALAAPSKETPTAAVRAELNTAIDKDALCNLPWFNLGVLENEAGARREARDSFLAAAILWPHDAKAWRNATLLCLGDTDLADLFPCILVEGNRCAGDAYIDALLAYAKELPPNLAQRFAEFVAQVPDLVESRQIPARLRLLGEESVTVMSIDENGATMPQSSADTQPRAGRKNAKGNRRKKKAKSVRPKRKK